MRRHAIGLFIGLLTFASASQAALFNVSYVDDNAGDFASRGWTAPNSLFQRNAAAAFAQWGSLFTGSSGIVNVSILADAGAPRAGGTFANSFFGVDQSNGLPIYESAAARNIKNNIVNDASTDLFIYLNPAFVSDNYWLDPTPGDRGDEAVPLGKTDLVSILMHEIGHGLGFLSVRSLSGANYGQVGSYETLFDSMTTPAGALDGNGAPVPLRFIGANASALVSGGVPLSNLPRTSPLLSQNFSHIECDTPTLTATLMNGCQVPTGLSPRLTITAIDAAIFRDLGLPINAAALPEPASWACMVLGFALAGWGMRRRAFAGWDAGATASPAYAHPSST